MYQDGGEEDDGGHDTEHDLPEIIHRQVGEPDLEAEQLGIGVAEHQSKERQNDQERPVNIDRDTEDPSDAERPSHGRCYSEHAVDISFLSTLFCIMLFGQGLRPVIDTPGIQIPSTAGSSAQEHGRLLTVSSAKSRQCTRSGG